DHLKRRVLSLVRFRLHSAGREESALSANPRRALAQKKGGRGSNRASTLPLPIEFQPEPIHCSAGSASASLSSGSASASAASSTGSPFSLMTRAVLIASSSGNSLSR